MKFFRKIFGTREEKLSKIEYWKRWEFFELFDDLDKAEQLLNSRKFNEHIDQKFKAEFIEELGKIEGDNVADFTRI